MVHFKTWLGSSVGMKQLVGLTGVAIALFSLSHMMANLLIPFSARAYNYYSHSLVTNPLLPLAEIALLLAFLLHVAVATRLWTINRQARPMGNASNGCGLKQASFASRSMILSGLLVFVFLVLHLITFKYGTHYTVIYDGVEMRDLHRLVVEKFHEPLYTAWYLFALAVLGLHLSHGIASLFQSLGLNSARKYWVKQVGWAFALVITGGFMVTPIWVICCGGN